MYPQNFKKLPESINWSWLLIFILIGCNSDTNQLATPDESVASADTWVLTQDNDDFGDPIDGAWHIEARLEGTAVHQGNLKEKLSVAIFVFFREEEQEKLRLSSAFSEGGKGIERFERSYPMNIQIKLPNGDTKVLKQFSYETALSDIDGELLDILLKTEGSVKVRLDRMQISSFNDTIYLYEIDTEGLKKAIEDLREAMSK